MTVRQFWSMTKCLFICKRKIAMAIYYLSIPLYNFFDIFDITEVTCVRQT